MKALETCDVALTRAVDFLLKRRVGGEPEPNRHYWRDFNAYGNESDEWVTAYAACALAETGKPEAIEAACQAWNWLLSSSSSHGLGLGYSTLSPQDADSTAWGLRLAAAIGCSQSKFAKHAFDHLKSYAREDGGIATFAAADVLKIGFGSSEDAVRGWTTSHICVTAPAAWLTEVPEFADVFGFLARAQETSGRWRAYWWADDEYATAYAIESLVRAGMHPEAVERGAGWLERSWHNNSPFVLALRILGSSKAGATEFQAALEELLQQQLADGSWAASSRVRLPPPYLRDPQIQWNWDEQGNGIGSIIVDRNRIFTTATAVRALSACLMQ